MSQQQVRVPPTSNFHTDSSSDTESETQLSDGPLSENEGHERPSVNTSSSSLPLHIAASVSPSSIHFTATSSSASATHPFQQFQQPQPSAAASSSEVEPQAQDESSLVLDESSSSSVSFLPGRDPAIIQAERERRAQAEQERVKHLKGRHSLQLHDADGVDLNTTLPPPNLEAHDAASNSNVSNFFGPGVASLTADSLAQHTRNTPPAPFNQYPSYPYYQHHHHHHRQLYAQLADDDQDERCSCTNSYSDDDYSICSCSVATDSSSEFGSNCSDCCDEDVAMHSEMIQGFDQFKKNQPLITQGIATLLIGLIIGPKIVAPIWSIIQGLLSKKKTA